MALYAFNIEVSRAPWHSSESAIAEMRLQWWKDAVLQIESGGPVPRHDICESLRDAVNASELPIEPLLTLIEARKVDIFGLLPDRKSIGFYVSSTSESLMWLAAQSLGTPRKCERAVRDFGWGTGISSLFRAEPQLAARGRALFRGRPELVRELASAAMEKISSARSSRREMPGCALAALLAGWCADRSLKKATADPGTVERGELTESEFRRRASLSWRSITGRW